MPPLPKYSPGTPSFTGYTNADFNIVPKSLLEELQAQEKALADQQIREAQAAQQVRQNTQEEEFAKKIQDPSFSLDQLPSILAQSGDPKYAVAALNYQNYETDNKRQREQMVLQEANRLAEAGDVNGANAARIAAGLPPANYSGVGWRFQSFGSGGLARVNDATGQREVVIPDQGREPPAPQIREAVDPMGTRVFVDARTGKKVLTGYEPIPSASSNLGMDLYGGAPGKTEGRAPPIKLKYK